MKFEVEYTSNFELELKKLAKKYKSIKKDIQRLISSLEENPILGVPLGKDCYKIRLAISSKGRGKSGGARVITHIYIAGNKVFLISIYDKSSRESISDAEIKALLKSIR